MINYDATTRRLHALLAVGVVVQLLLSLGMDPEAKVGTPATLFEIHETLGLILVVVVATHWVWALAGHAPAGIGALWPWFSRKRLLALKQDIGARLSGGRVGGGMLSGPLVPAVHGLGLLLVAAMTLSGLIWWLGVEPAKDIHETVAPLVWAYLVGHVAAAVWHQWRGEPLIARMFKLRR